MRVDVKKENKDGFAAWTHDPAEKKNDSSPALGRLVRIRKVQDRIANDARSAHALPLSHQNHMINPAKHLSHKVLERGRRGLRSQPWRISERRSMNISGSKDDAPPSLALQTGHKHCLNLSASILAQESSTVLPHLHFFLY